MVITTFICDSCNKRISEQHVVDVDIEWVESSENQVNNKHLHLCNECFARFNQSFLVAKKPPVLDIRGEYGSGY